MLKDVKTVAVLGAGIMGNGIAQVCATAGYKVYMRDISDEFVQRGMDSITKSLDRMLKKEKITEEDKKGILERITPCTDLETAGKDADVVIEAITENMDLKKETFQTLDKICKPSTYFFSNTSNLSITAMASVTSRPDKFAGMHFMSPPAMKELIELIKGMDTSDETMEFLKSFTESLNKIYVVCLKDVQGFATSRIINLWLIEAIRIVYEGVMSPEDLDKACKYCFGHPMGPIQLADFVGLDTLAIVANDLKGVYGSRYLVPENLRKMVDAGYLGVKSGRGFYTYDKK